MFSKKSTIQSTENFSDKITKIKDSLDNADAIVVGAGAGLSTSAGLNYGGERFQSLFSDYIKKYNLTDMYSAAFYDHNTLEEYWGYWCKHIYHNRYAAEIGDTYKRLLNLLEGKNYFVLTTNADHLFRLNGFGKERLFYMQGDYGLFQCSVACHKKTYDNKEAVMEMMSKLNDLKIPTNLIPYCPVCGKMMTANLRKDGYFVEDEGWHAAMDRYSNFISKYKNKKTVFLELGVGYNTPSIIKYPFWQMTNDNNSATFISLNYQEATCPKEIEPQSILIEDDISAVLAYL